MSPESLKIKSGLKVNHPELGEGVVVALEQTGYVTVFSVASVSARFLLTLYKQKQIYLIRLFRV